MRQAAFTVRVLRPNPHREGTMAWRAGQLVTAMAGCDVDSIVRALMALERDTGNTGIGNPPRWLTHFAGLETKASGKALDAWLEIVGGGQVIRSREDFKRLLADR